MSEKNILIVDDESDIRELLEVTISRMGFNTESAENVEVAKNKLSKKSFDLCLTDMKLPDGNGIDIIEYIQKNCPDTPTAMITAYGSVDTAIAALKAGAFDFVSKPIDLKNLRELIKSAFQLETTPKETLFSDGIQLLGNTPAIEKLRIQIRKLARSQAPIYISGESGSGKELVARLIHLNSARHNGPFIPVNCGAIPSELMESEFFGHKKGSFTGASDNKIGLFAAAEGGTLFLDEIADLPLVMQVKLLRAIQEKAIRAVGDSAEKPINVRILSATHKDLNLEVEKERFRSDLYYRLNVIELSVPNLRDRKDDIPLLAEHLLNKLALSADFEKPIITDAALQRLRQHSFPGNVRELENILERAFTLAENNCIDDYDLAFIDNIEKSSPAIQKEENLKNTSVKESLSATNDLTQLPPEGSFSLEEYLESIERAMIEKALEECRWNKTAAAKRLGMSFRSLRYRLKKLNID